MNELIDTLIALIKTAIDTGVITGGADIGLTRHAVYKGFSSMPDAMIHNAYITFDDGGERTEVIDSHQAQMRYFSVIIEFGVMILDTENALTAILNFSNQIKNVIESENTQLAIRLLKDTSDETKFDNYCWGVNIEPYEVEVEKNRFFRIRQVTIDFMALEDRRFEH